MCINTCHYYTSGDHYSATSQKFNLELYITLKLTNDNPQAASHIAKSVGITNFHSECLPEDNMLTIEKYQNENKMICMVGDGINDAPALKKHT